MQGISFLNSVLRQLNGVTSGPWSSWMNFLCPVLLGSLEKKANPLVLIEFDWHVFLEMKWNTKIKCSSYDHPVVEISFVQYLKLSGKCAALSWMKAGF